MPAAATPTTAAASVVTRFMRSPARRTSLQVAADATAWAVALVFAVLVRYDFAAHQIAWGSAAVAVVAAVLVHAGAGFATGVYRRRFVSGSALEVRAVAATVTLTGLVVGLPVLLLGTEFHLARSTAVIATPVAFVLMGSLRYIARLLLERRSRPRDDAQRTLIFGAGRLANHLVRRMLTDPDSAYVPVGLIDDDPTRAGLRIEGVRVLGTRRDLVRAAADSGAEALIVGIARADAALLQEITDLAATAGSGCWCCRPWPTSSMVDRASETSGTSPSRTSSAVIPSTRTSSRSRAIWRARGCSSPGRAARSAASCAGRSPATRRPS